MRAAANDALVQRTLHPPRIPRKPAAGGRSARLSSTGSAQASSSGASRPTQKQSATSSPSGQSGKKRKNSKGKAPFSSSSGGSGLPEEKEKVPERSQPDGTSLPLRVGGCLAPHWRRWQAIGVESWVVTVLPSWTLLLPFLAPRYRFRRTGQALLRLKPCSKRSRRCLPKEP